MATFSGTLELKVDVGEVNLEEEAILAGLTSLLVSGPGEFIRKTSASSFENATPASSGGSGVWGLIAGTLADQTDLKSALDLKQAVLVSGTNIKTINSTSLLGAGNLTITATPAGLDTYIQFNDGGVFGGDSSFFWDKVNKGLRIGIEGNPADYIVFGAAPSVIVVADPTINNTSGSYLAIQAARAKGTGSGGAILFNAGSADTIGTGGNLEFNGGPGGSVSGNGGDLILIAGLHGNAGTDGRVLIKSPSSGVPSAELNISLLTTAQVFSFPDASGTFAVSASGYITLSASGNITFTGPLAVTDGGTGTTTQFTQGSVIFAGASGIYTEDNSGLFYDTGNKRLGIGTPSPSEILHISVGTGVSAKTRFDSGTTQGYFFAFDGDPSVNFGSNSNTIVNFRVNNVTTASFNTSGNFDLVGKISTYNNIVTVSNGVASEVATIDSTGLTANVGASTLYSVPGGGEGMYRVNTYVVETTAGSISSNLPNVQIVYTDNDSNTSVTIDATPVFGVAGIGQTGALNANTVGTASSGVIVIYVKANTTIQYQTVNYASNLAGMTYALRLKLEAL